jgi:hypothetical protein
MEAGIAQQTRGTVITRMQGPTGWAGWSAFDRLAVFFGQGNGHAANQADRQGL